MANSELKSLIEEMCVHVNNFVIDNDKISKEHIVEYLKNSAGLIESLTDAEVDSYQDSKGHFVDEYKEIAKQTLTSYKSTNNKFTELSQLHEEAIIECTSSQIDLPKLTNKFTEIQQHMADEVTKANSIITQLQSQVKQLEVKSSIDSLTKVYNRGALISYLTKMCARENVKYDSHLLILDIDDFKLINDRFGHIAGDKILIFIANILKKTLRDGDKVFRYGGEEFVIILNRIDDEKCLNITQRMLRLVSDNKLIYKGDNIHVTVSIGTTKFKAGDTQDSFINRADKALYRAKHNGKNQMASELA